jgi:hypothetical protein
MPAQHEFTADEIRGHLWELTRRLDEAGVVARIHIFGGSAVALHFGDDDETRTTRDIDALYRPAPEVQKIIAEMATEFGLPPTWLNSSGANYLPAGMPASGETITVAAPEELVAMKLAASREQDLYDLGILARNTGLTEPEQLVDIAFEAYGEDSVVLTDSRNDYFLAAKDALARLKP